MTLVLPLDFGLSQKVPTENAFCEMYSDARLICISFLHYTNSISADVSCQEKEARKVKDYRWKAHTYIQTQSFMLGGAKP